MQLDLDNLEMIDSALNNYRETLEARKDLETLEELEALQNTIRQEWREIKERKAWEEYYLYIESTHGKIPTIKDYFKVKEA